MAARPPRDADVVAEDAADEAPREDAEQHHRDVVEDAVEPRLTQSRRRT